MQRPSRSSWARRAGRTRNVTSAPLSASRPPKYPPIAPAPKTRNFIDEHSPRFSAVLRGTASKELRMWFSTLAWRMAAHRSLDAEWDWFTEVNGGRCEQTMGDRAVGVDSGGQFGRRSG